MAFDFDELSDREILATGIGLLVVLCIATWAALGVFLPSVETHLRIAGGPVSGAYQPRALRLAAALAKEGVSVDVSPSSGSLENLARLQAPAGNPRRTDAALLQGGIVDMDKMPELETIARLGYEPVWMFYAPAQEWQTLAAVRGRRVSVGSRGSGTQPVARALLRAAGVDAGNATLVELNNEDALAALHDGRIDAFFAVAALEAPFIRRALADGERFLPFTQGNSIASRLPWLTPLVLPRGSLSLEQDLPPADTAIIAVRTELVARSDLHPATKVLLRRAALADQKSAVSPLMRAATLAPANAAADDSSVEESFLQKHLPFWWAQLFHRLSLSVLPIALVLGSSMHALMEFRRRRTHLKILRMFAQAKEIQLRVAEKVHPDPGADEKLKDFEEQLRSVSPRVASVVDYYRLRSVLTHLKLESARRGSVSVDFR